MLCWLIFIQLYSTSLVMIVDLPTDDIVMFSNLTYTSAPISMICRCKFVIRGRLFLIDQYESIAHYCYRSSFASFGQHFFICQLAYTIYALFIRDLTTVCKFDVNVLLVLTIWRTIEQHHMRTTTTPVYMDDRIAATVRHHLRANIEHTVLRKFNIMNSRSVRTEPHKHVKEPGRRIRNRDRRTANSQTG